MAPDDGVRAAHNEVAGSPNPAQASTRPAWTSGRELDRMVQDVAAGLDLRPDSDLLELGCGTGVLAVPLAARVDRFVGVDFAEAALEVLERRLEALGLAHRAGTVCLDVVHAPQEAVSALGTFERVLVYATLHYVADEAEGRRFVERAVALARPDGLVLFGSLPVADRHRIPSPLGWRLRGLAYRVRRRLARAFRRRPPFEEARLAGPPPVRLTTEMLEEWLAGLPFRVRHEWRLPRVGTPMFARRVDLVVRREA